MKNVEMNTIERFAERMEHLLMRCDSVAIPGWGRFGLQTIPAVYNADEHSFTPARKKITFEPTPALAHDNLLTNAYMQAFSIDRDEARQLMENDVAAAKQQLDDDGELQLGAIGLLVKDGERIAFMPDKHSDEKFNLASYGLPAFHYFPLSMRQNRATAALPIVDAPLPENVTPNVTPTLGVHLPATLPVAPAATPEAKYKKMKIMRICLQTASAAAIATSLFLVMTTPVDDVSRKSYSAGFIPHDIIKTLIDAPVAGNENLPTTVNAPLDVKTESETESIDKKNTAAKIASTKDKDQQQNQTPYGRKYYVVIGSFQTRKQAQAYIKRLKNPELETADIIVHNGHVRVYAQSFSSEETALAYMRQIRRKPGHEQAWLFKEPQKK